MDKRLPLVKEDLPHAAGTAQTGSLQVNRPPIPGG